MRVHRVLLALIIVAGCGKPKPAATEAEAIPPAAAAQAKQIFSQRCVACHGANGQGDGPASASLNPKPRKFADPAWQQEVTDEYIEKIVKQGGLAVGKSAAMPPNPDLNDPQVIAGLRAIVRDFKSAK